MNVSGIKEIRVQMTKAEREFRELFRELGKNTASACIRDQAFTKTGTI